MPYSEDSFKEVIWETKIVQESWFIFLSITS
nr:MAG TPA: hypothetical protein [Caudoviricetes sp.]